MKRDETYVPYKERTPKELCRDITIKAETLFLKKDKYGLLFFAVFFLVLLALHLYYKTHVHLWFGFLVVGIILVGGFFVFKPYSTKYYNYRSLIWGVGLIVCLALQWREMTTVNWWLGAIVVGFIEVVTAVCHTINQKLVHDLNLAINPKQFLPIAKRLKRCFQIRNIVCLTLLFCLPLLALDVYHDVRRLVILLIVYVIGALFSNKDFWIDITFCEDLEELEYRLEE